MARPIRGSPRWRRRRREHGARRSRATARRAPSAARSRTRSRCATARRRGRIPSRGPSGRSAAPGTGRPRTSIRRGSKSCSMHRSTRRRRGRRCTKCTRGGGGQPPRCREWWNIENPEPPRAAPEEEIAAAPIEMARLPGVPLRAPTAPPRPVASPASKLAFLFPRLAATTGSAGMMSEPRPLGLEQLFGLYVGSIVADGVHSGSGRTTLADNNTDYYPVALNQDELRPGTVYADPYGHMLVLVRRVPQSAGAAGVFLAVDAQPDATVSRKRFWRGNFLFAQDPALGGPGFKRFRPIVREKSGALRRLTNEEIAKNPQYGDFALDQGRLAIEDFYDRMDDVMSPAPLDPLRAMQEAITSLEEQVKARVISVENGRKYQASGRDASMPEGAAIFETTGAWEDFATPARDLRLLIA